MIRQYYKDADAGFDSTIDVGVILTIRWVAIIGQGVAPERRGSLKLS